MSAALDLGREKEAAIDDRDAIEWRAYVAGYRVGEASNRPLLWLYRIAAAFFGVLALLLAAGRL